ncbi:DUF4238 domain-containing protein [Chryseobacterium indologenes]|uniref:DUF4238 domain-containing protein n=1 Tax=Chryseobacterium indologenes TaxID=253 RepID=UPI0040595704
MSQSQKHHFLPVFYLKRFANENEQFKIFNVKTKRFKQKGLKEFGLKIIKNGKHSEKLSEKFKNEPKFYKAYIICYQILFVDLIVEHNITYLPIKRTTI